MTFSSEIARLLLDQEAVLLRPREPFTFASGIRSPIYCDNRLLLSDPTARTRVVEGFLELLRDIQFDVVGGVATAGIAWGAWLADRLRKPMVYVRGSAKEHGRKNQVEGRVRTGDRVVLVEDLISTGGSVLAAAAALQDAGAAVGGIVSIFTYGFSETSDAFEKSGISLRSIVTLQDVLAEAIRLKKISRDDESLVTSWQCHPRSFSA